MKRHNRKGDERWTSIAIAGAAMLAAAACSGCLYTVVPAMAGPSTTYQQPADSQSAAEPSPAAQSSPAPQASQPSNVQTNQNKPQNGAQP
jgi:hypothetical protein